MDFQLVVRHHDELDHVSQHTGPAGVVQTIEACADELHAPQDRVLARYAARGGGGCGLGLGDLRRKALLGPTELVDTLAREVVALKEERDRALAPLPDAAELLAEALRLHPGREP